MIRRSVSLLTVLTAILFCAAYLTGCGAATQSPALGILYTDVKGPVAVTGNTMPTVGMLVGTATAQSFLGLIATGDASIATAAKSAGITKIHHVDSHSINTLGIVATYTVIVYGE